MALGRPWALMSCCHLFGGAALDRHQDNVGLGQGCGRIGGDPERVGLIEAIAAFEVGDLQPPRIARFHARSRQKNHLASGQRQATADITADAAGAGNDDGLFGVGHADNPVRPATIRHENHNVGGRTCHRLASWP